MKQADLTSVIAKLEAAKDSFDAAFNGVEQHWADANRRDFEEEYVAAIEPNIKRMTEAIARLATELANASHQCGTDFQ